MPNAPTRPIPAEYQEWAPPPSLAGAVACIWTRGDAPRETPLSRTIVPDNSIDLIWRLHDDGSVRSAVVVGPMSRPHVLSDDMRGRFVAVRFEPGQAARALRIPAQSIRDLTIEIDYVLRGARAIMEQSATLTVDDVGRILENTLGPAIDRAGPVPASLRHALDLAHASQGRESVERIANRVGLTRQHLARMFDTHVGLRPKFVARVLRLRHVMALAAGATQVARGRPSGPSPAVSWSALAAEAGYTDQPHMVSDFVSLTGVTPSQWLASR